MKMPAMIDLNMLAPCGVNCAVCYKHVGAQKTPCNGCQNGEQGKTWRCINCAIKCCVAENGVTHCFACTMFPCKRIKNLARSYKRYHADLIHNNLYAKEAGISAFLEKERQKWLCTNCGGVISLQDNACSICGEKNFI